MIHAGEAAPRRAAFSPRPAARPSSAARPPVLSSGSRAWLRRLGAPRARSPGGRGHPAQRRGEGEAVERARPGAAGMRGLGHMRTGRAEPRDVKVPDAEQPWAPSVGREWRPGRYLRPGWRAPAPQPGERAPGSTGAEGRRTARARAAAGPRRDGGKPEAARRMRLGCRARRGAAPRPAVGPAARPSAPGAMQQLHLATGLRGPGPRPPLPRGSLSARSQAVKGPGPKSPAGRSPHSPVRDSAAGAGAALRAPWSRRAAVAWRPRPAPHRTQRRQRRRLRPGHGRGHAPSRLGAWPEQEGGSAPAPPTRGFSLSRFARIGERLSQWGNGRSAERRRRGAGDCGGGGSHDRSSAPDSG